MEIEELQEKFQCVQKQIKRSALEIDRVEPRLVDDLISLRRASHELEGQNIEELKLIRIEYYIECYLLNFQKAKEYLKKIVQISGEQKAKKDLYILNELLKNMSEDELTPLQLWELCHYVEEKLQYESCNHTHKYTREWLENHVPKGKQAKIIKMLQNRGGYCDCEVVLNVLET